MQNGVSRVTLITQHKLLKYLGFIITQFCKPSSYVEGRALSKVGMESYCRFILEDIVSRYGYFCQMWDHRKELNSQESKDFFRKQNEIDLKSTTTYNFAANGKVEHEHAPIVNALVKACGGRSSGQTFCHFLSWPDRTTTTIVIRFALSKLINMYLQLILIESSVTTWRIVSWTYQVSREELLKT